MVEVIKHNYLTRRNGVFYYKRPVPKELHAPGRPKQIWKSLHTSDERPARIAYRQVDAETDTLFETWRKGATLAIRPAAHNTTPLSAALLRQLLDAHYLDVIEDDFKWRGGLWAKTRDHAAAFWRGDVIPLPTSDDGHTFFDHLVADGASLEEVFLCCVAFARRERLRQTRNLHRLGDNRNHGEAVDALLTTRGLSLSEKDHARLALRLMEVEIGALEELVRGDGFNAPQAPQQKSEAEAQPGEPISALLPMSALLDKYINDAGREAEWTLKDSLRWRGHLDEFLEIAGDKPINRYTQADGVSFKDTQLALPRRRGVKPFRGLRLLAAAKLAKQTPDVELLSPLTINDKIGCVSRFFSWARSRDGTVTNPVEGLAVKRKKRGRNKERFPWRIDELNRMFQAPIYTGCQSVGRWRKPGSFVPRQSAIFWVPLIGLFSGMRLGEIIQLRVGDVKTLAGIRYFDVTTLVDEDEVTEKKSVKTGAMGHRGIAIHQTLREIGFDAFLEYRRKSGSDRLFPEFAQAKDDASWSKAFSKHFTRFRTSLGVIRNGVGFHSLRHNVEDALRNADVRKEVRDAIQGHSDSGVSREYGTGYYVETLNEAVQKIQYVGLDLAHLHI